MDLVPPTVQETTRYSLRNSGHIQNYRASTNLFLDSFFPATIRAWNNLPAETKEASTLTIFKSFLNRNTQTPPKYFNAGTRLGQILHARLRMDCSSLNSDLYRKHIIPSPSCRCGGFESVQHFFFSRPNFSVARERYLPADLRSYSVKALHGKTNLTSQENITKTRLFKYIENFTSKTENFKMKISNIFHISAHNIDCEYSLEPHRRGGSNEYHNLCF